MFRSMLRDWLTNNTCRRSVAPGSTAGALIRYFLTIATPPTRPNASTHQPAEETSSSFKTAITRSRGPPVRSCRPAWYTPSAVPGPVPTSAEYRRNFSPNSFRRQASRWLAVQGEYIQICAGRMLFRTSLPRFEQGISSRTLGFCLVRRQF